MADPMRPVSKKDAPDPSDSYERSHPEREAGMGRLDNNDAVPAEQPEAGEEAVKNRQDPDRQINAQESAGGTIKGEDLREPTAMREDPGHPGRMPPAEAADHSMFEEEPDGWDLAPTDIQDPRRQRHPRVGGKGGTPNAGEDPRQG